HDLADLGRMHARERAAEHGEILAEDVDQPAVDRAVAGHHAVTRHFLVLHAEIDRAMLDEHVVFFERAGIEQRIDALACRQLALGVLRLDAALAAAQARRRPAPLQLFQHLLHSGTPAQNVRFRPNYLPGLAFDISPPSGARYLAGRANIFEPL